jgi:calcineurin-like phosphoesterase family protein
MSEPDYRKLTLNAFKDIAKELGVKKIIPIEDNEGKVKEVRFILYKNTSEEEIKLIAKQIEKRDFIKKLTLDGKIPLIIHYPNGTEETREMKE